MLFRSMQRESEDSVLRTVCDLCSKRLPNKYGEGIVDKIQVISPTKKGSAGTYTLNINLQGILNPPSNRKKEYKYKDKIFRVGDKVMQIKNNYELEWEEGEKSGVGVFNGDIGYVEDISFEDETLSVVFDKRRVTYDFFILDELELAYAITVHKSQGSGATRSLVKS